LTPFVVGEEGGGDEEDGEDGDEDLHGNQGAEIRDQFPGLTAENQFSGDAS
jgi:hypothetical protein